MPRPIDVRFTIRDGEGKSSGYTVHVPAETVLADILTFAQTIAPLLDALTDGRVEGAQALIPIDLSEVARKLAPLAQSNNELGGLIVFDDTLGNIVKGDIPALVVDAVEAGSKILKGDYAPLLAWTNALILGAAGVRAVSLGGNFLADVKSARQNFKSNFKGRAR